MNWMFCSFAFNIHFRRSIHISMNKFSVKPGLDIHAKCKFYLFNCDLHEFPTFNCFPSLTFLKKEKNGKASRPFILYLEIIHVVQLISCSIYSHWNQKALKKGKPHKIILEKISPLQVSWNTSRAEKSFYSPAFPVKNF